MLPALTRIVCLIKTIFSGLTCPENATVKQQRKGWKRKEELKYGYIISCGLDSIRHLLCLFIIQ